MDASPSHFHRPCPRNVDLRPVGRYSVIRIGIIQPGLLASFPTRSGNGTSRV